MIGLVTFAAVKQYVAADRELRWFCRERRLIPRSLMQGDYAILDYEIADIPDDMKTDFASGDEVIVVLVERDEVWVGIPVSGRRPALPRRNGEVFIRGQMQSSGRIDLRDWDVFRAGRSRAGD